MKILDCKQLSPEWWEARRGVPTASEFSRILTPKKLELASAADDYCDELIAEKLSPATPGPQFTSQAARDGIDGEDEARRWYEFTYAGNVERVGFCLTDDGRFGCSPDGLVIDKAIYLDAKLHVPGNVIALDYVDGGLEIKRPLLKTHLRWLRQGGVPAEHLAQVHGGLVVTGLPWWDFVSYVDVRDIPQICVRTEPNSYTEKLRSVLNTFWDIYQQRLDWLSKGDQSAERFRLAIAQKGDL